MNLQSDRFWEPLCRAIGREDLAADPRYDTVVKRGQHGPELVEIFAVEFARQTTDEWVPKLDEEGIRWGKVQTTLEATQDEQAWANEYYQKVSHPDAGEITLVSSPLQFDGEPSPIETPAPEVGQHTEEILIEAGYSSDEIKTLRNKRAIH